MSIADKLTTIAENTPKVYEAGRKLEHDRFWDDVQDNGTRTFYERAFSYWNMEYIRPKHKVVPSGSRSMNMFSNNNSLKMVEKKYFDLSNVTVSQGGESSSNLYAVFYSCPNLEIVEDIGMPAGGYYMTFNRCPKLHTIEVMRVVEQSEFTSVFTYCSELVNLTIEGTIGKNGFNVSPCPKLSHDSLMSIINCLKDYSADTSGTSWVVTLGTENLAKLTDAEKNIATEKGWTLV